MGKNEKVLGHFGGMITKMNGLGIHVLVEVIPLENLSNNFSNPMYLLRKQVHVLVTTYSITDYNIQYNVPLRIIDLFLLRAGAIH